MSEYIIDWDTGLVIDTFSKNNLREEIVRCRDCKHFKSYESSFEPNLGYCREHDREEVLNYRFCAWGERRTND